MLNDLDLKNWKAYENIITDSLWLIDKRDSSKFNSGWYWGNFIPQIPQQMMLRYTRKGDWVLDPFLGSGTTLIESKRLGRNGIGIELNSEVAVKVKELIVKEPGDSVADVIIGDSQTIDLSKVLSKHNINSVQLVILHPPYYNIIKFSDDPADLSNAPDIETFLDMFGRVVDNLTLYLDYGRYLVLVIGDLYQKGEWIPLGFYCVQRLLERDYLLKSIVVKNFADTRGKRNQENLWRYRALAGGFYVFKHEYIIICQKK